MRKILVLLAFLVGCAETDIRKVPVAGMDEVEKAKLITQLWQRCQQGVEEAQALSVQETRDQAKIAEERLAVGEGRIRILEDAQSYGRRAFDLAPSSSEQCTYWYALCASYLGWEYDIVGKLKIQQGKERGDQALVKAGEKSREEAKMPLTDGIKALRHYERVYYERSKNLQIYMWLGINYEMAGDLPSAYLVSREIVRKLEGVKRGGANASEVDPLIEKYKSVLKKLEDQMRKQLIPIPK
jgi:hypothetical protein